MAGATVAAAHALLPTLAATAAAGGAPHRCAIAAPPRIMPNVPNLDNYKTQRQHFENASPPSDPRGKGCTFCSGDLPSHVRTPGHLNLNVLCEYRCARHRCVIRQVFTRPPLRVCAGRGICGRTSAEGSRRRRGGGGAARARWTSWSVVPFSPPHGIARQFLFLQARAIRHDAATRTPLRSYQVYTLCRVLQQK